MYDIQLFEDIKDFKVGISNIYELEHKYYEINKIIQNRTKEKIWLLNEMLEKQIIDSNYYKMLMKRVKIDYKNSKLYVTGLMSLENI